ncbi:MAG: sortase [Bacilli bacterium]|nr:sortase [Bacilli bacterium]
MVKKLYIILLLLIVISTPLSIIKISKAESYNINNIYGQLIIKKINLKEELFPINSSENTIEKHVSILKESNKDLMIIAAHSGIGPIAYFQELDKLELNDEVILIIENKKETYIVKDIWEEKKNGYINFNKETKKQLILTTCSPNKEGYQLVINCIEKESN